MFALGERRNSRPTTEVESSTLKSRKVPLVTTTSLPVLFVPDLVVLPGMVVPIELDEVGDEEDGKTGGGHERHLSGLKR